MTGKGDVPRSFEAPRIVRLERNLYAACFSLMKLLPARYILDRAQAAGRLLPGGSVVETTSGTFGLALAMTTAVRGFELTLVTANSLIDPPLRRRLEQLGASLHVVEDASGSGAQAERLMLLKKVLERRPETYWPQQYDNPDNRWAYGSFAESVCREIGRVDCLVGCVGSGGSLCGTGGLLREMFAELVILAVDTQNSVLFGHPPGPRLLRGLGNSVLPSNLQHELIDDVHWVGVLPAFAAARQLYRQHAVFMGPTSGAAALVAAWYARRQPDATTLVILPDEGHRYQHTLYNDDWLVGIKGWPVDVPREPVTLSRIEAAGEGDWTRLAWARRALATVTAGSCRS
ncbi:PLP-dependent cysteine synthase family protein [Stappia sp. MMSF_3263]|uniref:PLP-dependent cysteine synthase family protein n=1 Tax=Stappia sp. MMSF_3263 TaxID=3046693 RepID=UPI00273DE329|nr:pyridoxal-phosphate dependent enzyme [Stappia sp. MMSF_3263]